MLQGNPLLSIKNLFAGVADLLILKGINLELYPGKIHVILGPKGSGKSALGQLLAGNNDLTIKKGEVLFKNESLLSMSADQRAKKGLYFAFQKPVLLPGISNAAFLKSAVNSQRKHQNLSDFDSVEFLEFAKKKLEQLNLRFEAGSDFFDRTVNQEFSNQEKNHFEILQMELLQPALGIVDEPDLGLEAESLKQLAESIHRMQHSERSFLIFCEQYQFIEYLRPDAVHILFQGRIAKTGGEELAKFVEHKNYEWLEKEVCETEAQLHNGSSILFPGAISKGRETHAN